MLKLFCVSTVLAGAALAQTGPFAGGLVTGAPYSADEVIEMAAPASGPQTALSVPVGHLYRDSAGRTRTERAMFTGAAVKDGNAAEPAIVIEINDPVAGVRYTLDDANKVVHKQTTMSLAKLTDPRLAAIMGRVPTMTPPPPPGGLGAPSQIGIPAGQMLQPEYKNESLGTQTIEGVTVEGTRHTATLPDGTPGSTGPIVTVSETWISPELKITLLSKESDPRLGERTTKLVNVKRGEPSATLFAPPADYKVVEPAGSAIQPGRQK